MNCTMKKNNPRRAFSLIELMVVTVVIGILVAIAMFSYNRIVRNSMTSACMANLRQIDTAIARWAVENYAQPGVPPDEGGVYSYIRGERPHCPSGGNYTLEPYGNVPTVLCTKEAEGHRLPQ